MRAGSAAIVAGALTLSPHAAFAAAGDSWTEGTQHHEVMWDGGVTWLIGGASINRACPTIYPYLDANAGTPGRIVGQGFLVRGEVSVLEDRGYRGYVTVPSGVHKGRAAVTQTRLNGTNLIPFSTQQLYVERVCTSDPNRAWVP